MEPGKPPRWDALDPAEVPGHGLTVKGGPTSRELGSALELMFKHQKAAAFGIASYPAGRDSDGRTLGAVHNLIRAVMACLKTRPIA